MSHEEEMKAERARGYSLGYAAGKRRAAQDWSLEKIRRQETAFWERAFLVISPYFMGCEPWSQGDKKLSSLDDRTQLAADFANRAVKYRRSRL